jgi:AcrR family transcriptional regulator
MKRNDPSCKASIPGRLPCAIQDDSTTGRAAARREQGSGRGRPFSEGTERAILQATTELLAERGLAAMTIEDIAARARVGKASVYRRWPSKGTLALDAFLNDFLERQPVPDTGSLRDDLLGMLRAWVRAVRQPTTGRTLKGLIAEVQRDPELADAWRERFVAPLRARHGDVVQRAVERGELAPEASTGLLLDLLYGPAYHRLLHGHLPLNDAFIEDLVAAIMAAVDAGAI